MTPINAQATSDSHGLATAVRLTAETVVCGTCGCHLTVRESADAASPTSRTWYHFGGQPGHDARGCSVGCAEAPHTL